MPLPRPPVPLDVQPHFVFSNDEHDAEEEDEEEEEEVMEEEDHEEEDDDADEEEEEEVQEVAVDDDADEEEEEEVQEVVLDDDTGEGYHTILENLCNAWMESELDHSVSQSASNAFWKISFDFIPKLLAAKELQNIKRKIPQFNHIRRKLYDRDTPKVNMEIGYRNKESEEINVVKDCTTMPRKRFPPDKFEKVYEIATVKVKKNYYFHQYLNSFPPF